MHRSNPTMDSGLADALSTGSSQDDVEAAIQEMESEHAGTAAPASASDTTPDSGWDAGNATDYVVTSAKAQVARLDPTNTESTQAEVEAAVRRQERSLGTESRPGPSPGAVGSVAHSAPRAPATLAVALLSVIVVTALLTATPVGAGTVVPDVLGANGGSAVAQEAAAAASSATMATNESAEALTSTATPTTSSETAYARSPSADTTARADPSAAPSTDRPRDKSTVTSPRPSSNSQSGQVGPGRGTGAEAAEHTRDISASDRPGTPTEQPAVRSDRPAQSETSAAPEAAQGQDNAAATRGDQSTPSVAQTPADTATKDRPDVKTPGSARGTTDTHNQVETPDTTDGKSPAGEQKRVDSNTPPDDDIRATTAAPRNSSGLPSNDHPNGSPPKAVTGSA